MKTFRLQELRPGVCAAIAEEGGVAIGNAGFVAAGGDVLVFDCTLSLTAGRELREAAERQGRIEHVVYSHWHGDHVFGAGAMPAMAVVVATERTAALLEERAEPRLQDLKKSASEITEGPFAELARTELPQVVIVYPDETFADERAFDGARALTYGGGHTASDAFLWLEEERILFAADLVVVDTHPWIGDGDVREWRRILTRIAALEPETILPGHGPVAGPDALEFMHEYLETIERAESDAPVPKRYEALASPDLWSRNLAARSRVSS